MNLAALVIPQGCYVVWYGWGYDLESYTIYATLALSQTIEPGADLREDSAHLWNKYWPSVSQADSVIWIVQQEESIIYMRIYMMTNIFTLLKTDIFHQWIVAMILTM